MKLKKLSLPFKVKRAILALGSHTKNTLGFAKGHSAYFGPVYQDLDQAGDFGDFQRQASYFLKKKARIIAYDLHPGYRPTQYTLSLAPDNFSFAPTQHHHAHIASCMADNGLKDQRVLGVAFDGTGLGSDNTLWGAEFLVCDYRGFRRAGYLKPVRLLGGEVAIRQPWRLALLWLFLAFGERVWDFNFDVISKVERKTWQVLKKMYLSGFNSPLASSMGRLFDAVAVLVLGQKEAHFEAELAIKLERLAESCHIKTKPYPFKIVKKQSSYILDPLPMFKAMVLDLKHQEPKAEIAYRFHLTVAELTRKMLVVLRKNTKLNKVVLSGGVFQNRLLCRLVNGLLAKEKFKTFWHHNVPCHDAGIALGQIAIANHRS